MILKSRVCQGKQSIFDGCFVFGLVLTMFIPFAFYYFSLILKY